MLEEGRVAISLLWDYEWQRVDNEELELTELFTDPTVLLVGATHRLARRRTVGWPTWPTSRGSSARSAIQRVRRRARRCGRPDQQHGGHGGRRRVSSSSSLSTRSTA